MPRGQGNKGTTGWLVWPGHHPFFWAVGLSFKGALPQKRKKKRHHWTTGFGGYVHGPWDNQRVNSGGLLRLQGKEGGL